MTKNDVDLLVEVRAAVRSGRARRLRELSGLSQAEVAQIAGVSEPAVSRWEAGERRPTGRHALAYGRALRKIAEQVAVHG